MGNLTEAKDWSPSWGSMGGFTWRKSALLLLPLGELDSALCILQIALISNLKLGQKPIGPGTPSKSKYHFS